MVAAVIAAVSGRETFRSVAAIEYSIENFNDLSSNQIDHAVRSLHHSTACS